MLGDNLAGEVHHPHTQVVDIDLHANGRQGAFGGDEWDGGPSGLLRHHRWQFGNQCGHDEPIGQRRDGGAGQSGGHGNVGARGGHLCVDDEPEHQTEVVLAEVRLTDRRGTERSRLARRHGVDLSPYLR